MKFLVTSREHPHYDSLLGRMSRAQVFGVPRHEADKFKIAARPGEDEGSMFRITPAADLWPRGNDGTLNGKLVNDGGFIELYRSCVGTRAD